MDRQEKNYIFGIRAIIEAIVAGKTIDKLFIQKGLHNDTFAELWKLVRLRRINYKHVPIEHSKSDSHTSPDVSSPFTHMP